jgi:hypothetical protein
MANDSARVDDELDAVLDGHRRLYRSELSPAVEAAEILADRLRELELPPEVAERHVAMAMEQARRASTRTRRRTLARVVATAAAAAALVVVPASLVSARSLPGDALYPLKRSIEAADLAFNRDPCREAEIHMRIAETRIGELEALVQRRDTAHIVGALREVKSAVEAANVAVAEAFGAEGVNAETMALDQQLNGVKNDMRQEVNDVLVVEPTGPAASTASSILDAATTATTPAPPTTPTPSPPAPSAPAPPTTATPVPPTDPPAPQPPPTTGTPSQPAPTSPPPPTTAPPTTAPPTSSEVAPTSPEVSPSGGTGDPAPSGDPDDLAPGGATSGGR